MRQKRQNKQKDILFILGSSFIVVVAWIAFNIIHILATSTIKATIQSQLTPIAPNFDYKTMQQLKSRENVRPFFETQTSSSTATTTSPLNPSPTPYILAPLGSSSLTPTGTPPASNSSQFAPATQTSSSSASVTRQGQ